MNPDEAAPTGLAPKLLAHHQTNLGRRERFLILSSRFGADLRQLKAIEMLDVCFPKTAGRRLIMLRYPKPEPDQMLLTARTPFALALGFSSTNQGDRTRNGKP